MRVKKQSQREPSLESVRRELFTDSEDDHPAESESQANQHVQHEANQRPHSLAQHPEKPVANHDICETPSITECESPCVDQPVEMSLSGLLSISVLVICLLFIAATFAFPQYFEFKTVELKRSDGELYVHWHNNKRIYLLGLVSGTLLSAVFGFTCCCFSWTVTYFDSLDPGHVPPTPLSPAKYRKQSGHTFHMSYAVSILNGLAVFIYSLWTMRDSYLFI